MKKAIAILLSLCSLIALLSGCGGKPETPPNTSTPSETSSDTTESGSRDTVVVALPGNPVTLDPMMTNNGIDQMLGIGILSTIVEFDTDGSIIPNVASDWDISEDGMTYTFTLRDDVKFSNGDPLTASDVVFSVERALTSNYLASDWGAYVEGAEATGDYEVVIHMKSVYAPFMALCAKMLDIHDQAYYNDFIANGGTEEEYQMNLVGSGPYKFASYEEGVQVYLDANELYFKGEPSVKHLNFKIISDSDALAVALQNGDIDLIGIFTAVPSNQIDIMDADPNVTVQQSDPTKVYFMPVNCEQEGYSDVRVRQAISYAIDYDYINMVAANGKGSQATCSILGPNTFGYTEEGTEYSYDLDKAKALLADAGYPNGEGLGVMTATIREGMKPAMEAVQSCLADIGIQMEMNVMEDGVYLSECRKGNFTVSAVAYLVNVDAAINDSFFVEEGIGAMNIARYVNPTVISSLSSAVTSLDSAERQRFYDEAYGIIKDECPYIPLWYDPQFFLYTNGLNIGDIYPTVSLIKYENLTWE